MRCRSGQARWKTLLNLEQVKRLADGREKVSPDPGLLPGRNDAAIVAAALSDPGHKPRTPEHERKLRRVPQVTVMRKALGPTQEQFARFQIPLGALRDWEHGKSETDTDRKSTRLNSSHVEIS